MCIQGGTHKETPRPRWGGDVVPYSWGKTMLPFVFCEDRFGVFEVGFGFPGIFR